MYSLFLFSDPRTNPWFLMSSPFPTLVICLCYVYLVKVIYFRILHEIILYFSDRKPVGLIN